jgi:hypothetical protein
LPETPETACARSHTRTVIRFSPVLSPRRSAFETTFSISAIGSRADTPEFWSTYSLLRAWIATSSISSRMKRGTRTSMPASRVVHDSCSVIATPCSRLCG